MWWIALGLLLATASPSASQPGEAVPADLAAALLRAVNQVRREHGLAPLRESARLVRVAREHSRRMSGEGFFAHEDPGGGSAADRLRAAGIPFRVLGENLARVEGAADPARQVVEGWMASPTHRRNILDRRFGETGIGVSCRDGACHVTQLLLAPAR